MSLIHSVIEDFFPTFLGRPLPDLNETKQDPENVSESTT
jgi:hypothetical protein